MGDHAALRLGGRIGLPDLRQVVGGEELDEGRRIDLVGLRIGSGDRPGAQRVAHHHPAGMLGEELGDGPCVRNDLQDYRVVGAQARREGAQAGGTGGDPAEPLHLAAGLDGAASANWRPTSNPMLRIVRPPDPE